MSSFRVRSALIACALFGSSFADRAAQAEILFDNLAAPNPNGYTSVQNQQWTAQKFLTTATGTTLSEISLRLWKANNTTGAYAIAVWDATGASGSPGSQVGGAIYTGLAQNLSTDDTNLLTVSGLDVSLQPNTAYFIVASGSSLTDVPGGIFGPRPGQLGWSMTDTNPSGAYDGGPSTWAGPYTQNFYMKVEAVPEPSTSCMALAGLACGAFSMWRRRKRA